MGCSSSDKEAWWLELLDQAHPLRGSGEFLQFLQSRRGTQCGQQVAVLFRALRTQSIIAVLLARCGSMQSSAYLQLRLGRVIYLPNLSFSSFFNPRRKRARSDSHPWNVAWPSDSHRRLEILGDSKVVVNWMNGDWEVKGIVHNSHLEFGWYLSS